MITREQLTKLRSFIDGERIGFASPSEAYDFADYVYAVLPALLEVAEAAVGFQECDAAARVGVLCRIELLRRDAAMWLGTYDQQVAERGRICVDAEPRRKGEVALRAALRLLDCAAGGGG